MVKKVNPRIVYGSISGFGQSGPYAKRPGVDQIAQGMGGLMSITGLPGQGPVRVGIPIDDLCAGLLLAQAMLMALIERETSGEGQWVHTSLLEAQIFMLDFQASRWLMAGEVAKQAGNDHPTGIPTGVFPTSDGQINIAASGDHMFRRFCEAADAMALLDDPGLRDRAAALEEPQGAQRDGSARSPKSARAAYWVELMNEVGVPCGPIYTIDQTFADPQVQHLEMARPVDHPKLGADQGGRPGDQHDPHAGAGKAAPDPRSRPAHRRGTARARLQRRRDRRSAGARSRLIGLGVVSPAKVLS